MTDHWPLNLAQFRTYPSYYSEMDKWYKFGAMLSQSRYEKQNQSEKNQGHRGHRNTNVKLIKLQSWLTCT